MTSIVLTRMDEHPYERLAEALDRLPNGFPRTESGVEIRILERICSPAEAALAATLTGRPEPVRTIAARTGGSPGEIGRALVALARRGIAWPDRADGEVRFRLAPFIVGIYESQAGLLDRELAHLVEEYLTGGGARGIMEPQPALHRVLPSSGTARPEVILPYDDVRAIILRHRRFRVNDCICRLQQAQLGEPCSFPTGVCLSFAADDRPPKEGELSTEEALRLLDMTEQVGLVHTVTNAIEGVGYVCNCCGCCCGILRGITELGIAGSVASANYVAVIAPDLCADCGTCIERCQVHAISNDGGFAAVDPDRCIGCGLCVTGCPNDVARLERRPEGEIVEPPATFGEWETLRLRNRGLLSESA